MDLRSATEGSYVSWSQATRSGSYLGKGPVLDYDVFVSYARTDEDQAEVFARLLVARGLRVFFAPQSFPANGVIARSEWGPDSPGGWSSALKSSLVSSCHLVALITAGFVATPWCDLEYLGFTIIRSSNQTRKLFLYKADQRFDLPQMYHDYDAIVSSADSAADLTARAVSASAFRLGDAALPTDCFWPLPLHSVSFPSGAPWDDSEQGTIYEPPYRAFADFVRELMVRLRKGATKEQLLEGIEGLSKWRNHAHEGLHYAQAMLDGGVAPEGVARSERSDERQSSQVPLGNIARQLPTSSEPLQAARARQPVWDSYRTDDPGFVIEATCRRCGYSEQFNPPSGDRIYPTCPKCGYDGTDSLIT